MNVYQMALMAETGSASASQSGRASFELVPPRPELRRLLRPQGRGFPPAALRAFRFRSPGLGTEPGSPAKLNRAARFAKGSG